MKEKLLPYLTWLIRIITGATFVVSGFVKAIDPWGTLYKLEDYMQAMHLPEFHNLLIVGAFALSGIEFLIGVFLLLGCFRKSTPILAAIFMAVMLPLTFWIAVWNPVEDCGCFGDALVISNTATFIKNIILTAAVIYLLKFNKRVECLVRPSLQWLVMLFSAGYILAVSEGGYIYQPLVDFRPYPVGSDIIERSDENDSKSDEDENLYLVYEKDGEEKVFSINDELPDEESGWEFVRREMIEKTSGKNNTGETLASETQKSEEKSDQTDKNLRIWSEDGKEDVTEDVIPEEGREIILFMPDLKSVSIATTWQINSLSAWAEQNNIEMIGVASATEDEIDNWKDLSLASYPLYTADDTQIKMVVRGNPAVVYIKDGKIIWKSSLRALYTNDFLSPDAPKDPALYARDDRALLLNASGIYIAILAFLIILSLLPNLKNVFDIKPERIKTFFKIHSNKKN